MIKENFPLSQSKFAGGGGLTPDQANSLIKLLNDIVAEPNQVLHCDATNISVAGGEAPSILVDGDEWSLAAADWEVKVAGVPSDLDGTTPVAQADGRTTVKLDTPDIATALGIGANEVINITLRAKKKNQAVDAWISLGSISMPTAA